MSKFQSNVFFVPKFLFTFGKVDKLSGKSVKLLLTMYYFADVLEVVSFEFLAADAEVETGLSKAKLIDVLEELESERLIEYWNLGEKYKITLLGGDDE